MIALMGDIHSNMQALSVCLDDAAARGATRYVFLGDFVGYGANPGPVIEIIRSYVNHGAVAVRGNHDDMAADFDRDMNDSAARAANWTRTQLSDSQRHFLDDLPLAVEEEDRLYVHSDASAPAKWKYVTDVPSAALSLDFTSKAITFCGHVHQPAIYGQAPDGKITRFVPAEDQPVPLLKSRKWHVVLPSVGQPRDGNPLAGYGLFDPASRELTVCRVAYDIDEAAQAIRAAGLPDGLAARLHRGR